VLYVFLVLAHDRSRIVHFNVTAHPTAEWTGQQLREAFPFEQVPRYLLRDRNGIFGAGFTKEVRDLGLEEVLSAPRSPWQRAYIERVIGWIWRECLDHVVVLDEASLYRHLKSFMAYYHETRTHLSLEKDSPASRSVQPPSIGPVVALPQVGGLHQGIAACDHIGGAMSLFGWRAPGALGQSVSCHRQRADQCRRSNAHGFAVH
jgi:putative transposase